MLEAIPHIVWVAEPDGTTSYVNDFCVEYTGQPREANYHWGWTRLVHPADAELAEHRWRAAVCDGIEFRTEYRLQRHDGTFRWHVLKARPVLGPDGAIRTWVGSATDIDDEKQFAASLQKSEREAAEMLTLLDSVDAAAPVGFKVVDRQFRIVRINDRLARANGIPADEHIGRTVCEVAPQLWRQLGPVYRRALAGESFASVDITTADPDGSARQRHWLASFFPLRAGEEIVGVGNVVFDVTDRHDADEFRAVVMDNMAEGLFASDVNGRLTYMNDAAARMLGWREDELRGTKLHDIIHFQRADGEPLQEDACQLLDVRVRGRTIRNADDTFTRKDGTIVPVAYSAAPLRTGSTVNGVVVVFRDITEEMTKRDAFRREIDALTWIGRIRDAMDEDRLVLYSQPIEPLTSGHRCGEELLVRMISRDGTVVSPGTFLPVAEKYGLIVEIDRWVIKQAIRRAARGDRVVEVNLSAASLGTPDLLTFVQRELLCSGANPANLVFEITETALMRDITLGEAFAHGLAALGCGLALDDFGTGFGSFTYLKKLPVTHLKIDIEFVRDLVDNEANRRVVQVIVGLARAFGLETIAEGVEDEATLEQLRLEGVDCAQGFHIGRPAPIGD